MYKYLVFQDIGNTPTFNGSLTSRLNAHKEKGQQLLSYKYLAYYYIFVANLTLSSDTLLHYDPFWKK